MFRAVHANGLQCTFTTSHVRELLASGRLVLEGGEWRMGSWVVRRVGGGK